MKRLEFNQSWPESWKLSYAYDRQELWGDLTSPGYVHTYKERRDFVLNAVRQYATAGARVLDVAAGQGNFSLTLAEAGYHVTWNDLREDLIGYVQEKHENGQIEFMPGNIFEQEPEPIFDVVLATEVIEHVAHPDEFMAKISHWIRPGGCLVLTTPNGEYLRNQLPAFSDYETTEHLEAEQFKPDSDGHLFLLTEEEIRDFASHAGMKILSYRTFNAFFSAGYLRTGWIHKRLPFEWISELERISVTLPTRIQRRIHTSIGIVASR